MLQVLPVIGYFLVDGLIQYQSFWSVCMDMNKGS